MKRMLLVLLASSLLLPASVLADASVVQDSCVTWTEGGKTYQRIYMSVVNFSLPDGLCALNFIPEPQPPLAECTFLECEAPTGWTCFLNPQGGADWFANTPADCVAPGTMKSGFTFLLDPGFCCYVVQFGDATGAVMLEQEECFTLCTPVSVDNSSWGRIKSTYR